MFRHLLPNVVQPLIVHMTMGIGFAITMAAALSYIGLGVRPPTPEWGAILADGRSHILNYPYLIMFPGIVIALTVLAINLIGDGLRDALDPKLRELKGYDSMPNENNVLLSVRDLNVVYTARKKIVHAVNGVSFDVKKGETLGLSRRDGRR